MQQPNLVYIFADQLRYFSCGYAGDRLAQTPNIDRLAAEAIDLHHAISGHPLCAPYRASLFTGKYSSSTGMVINELRIGAEHEGFGRVLGQGGYRTAYIGKWHLWANQLGHHDDPRNAYIPPGPHRLGFDGFWAGYNFHHLYNDMYYYKDAPERIDFKGYEPDVQTDLAVKWLERAAGADQPFALFLSYGTPHDPWTADNVPPEYLKRFEDVQFALPASYLPENDPHADPWARMTPEGRAALTGWLKVYYAMIANLDWNVGRLFAALDESGQRENTILVFTSDHGELFGAHGRQAKNIFYEEAIRVPFLIRWPAGLAGGRQSDLLLNAPDIMPTLLGLMGLPIPAAVEGADLSRCLLGTCEDAPEAAFLQGMGCTAAWEDGYEWRALRTQRYTYAVYLSDRSELLFDNRADPLQMHNLAGDPAHAAVLAELRGRLQQRMDALNDAFVPCTWYRDHWTEDRIILRTAASPAA
jgi:arylsulfatase A-like enzyme